MAKYVIEHTFEFQDKITYCISCPIYHHCPKYKGYEKDQPTRLVKDCEYIKEVE